MNEPFGAIVATNLIITQHKLDLTEEIGTGIIQLISVVEKSSNYLLYFFFLSSLFDVCRISLQCSLQQQ